MLQKRDVIAGLLFLVLFVFACILISLPPHTDRGVELLEPGLARVHDGETLILWVPSGKTSAKYSFLYEDGMVTVDSFLHYDQRVIIEGCEVFRVSLFYKVEACREGQNMIFRWNESIFGIRIDK